MSPSPPSRIQMSDPDPDPPAEDLVVAANMSVDEDLRLASLRVAAGATLEVDGARIVVEGDVVVEEGATIESGGDLILVVRGELEQKGTLRAGENLVLVGHEDQLPTPEALAEAETEHDIGVESPEAADDSLPDEWRLIGELEAGHVSPTTRAATGKKGRRGGTIFISTGRRALLGPRAGLPRRIFNVRNGEAGEDLAGCDQTGGNGGRGGKVFLYASGWRLKNIDFVGGNGGRGGDAIGAGCADGDENSGGRGEKPGSFKLRASRYIVVDGDVTIDGFHAGHGGHADIGGAPTTTVHAIGGDAASIEGYRVAATGLTFATRREPDDAPYGERRHGRQRERLRGDGGGRHVSRWRAPRRPRDSFRRCGRRRDAHQRVAA